MVYISFSDAWLYKLPDGHRFPISKYELLKDQLLYEGSIRKEQLVDPGLCDEETIQLVHAKEYWQSLSSLTLGTKEIRKIGLPINEVSVNRARNTVAGTVLAAKNALAHGTGLNIGGGTHHAFEGWGEGFCILNDIAIASRYLLDINLARKILIVDLDVHQGNGTAAIFEGDNRVFTFSMHGKDNYPLKKEQSDLDIHLSSHTDDDTYLRILEPNLSSIIGKSKPDIIFYQAGVDVLEVDLLGKLALTKTGCRQRDEMVIQKCYNLQIPIVITTGGGYAAKLSDIVDAHANTFRTALDVFGS